MSRQKMFLFYLFLFYEIVDIGGAGIENEERSGRGPGPALFQEDNQAFSFGSDNNYYLAPFSHTQVSYWK